MIQIGSYVHVNCSAACSDTNFYGTVERITRPYSSEVLGVRPDNSKAGKYTAAADGLVYVHVSLAFEA